MVADATGAAPATSLRRRCRWLGRLCLSYVSTTTDYRCRCVSVDDAAKDTTGTAVAGSNQGISDAFAIGTDDLIHANAGRLAQARSAPTATRAFHFHLGSTVFV